MSPLNIVSPNLHSLAVNPDRLRADFDALAKIGETCDGGVNRSALSESHLTARKWFTTRIHSAGLEFAVDGAGNHSASLACGLKTAPSLLIGSHLDSVPNGGKYDGALGVLAALECLSVIKENDISLPINLEAIDFTDEESTYIGLLGSSALAGKISIEAIHHPRKGREELIAALRRTGISEESLLNARRKPHSLVGYIELHIEQGSRLLDAGADIGVVSAIVGISSFRLTFIGRADHAGTAPMAARLDAAQGASAFTLAVRELILTQFPDCAANVGNMRFTPAAFNIVPERVELSLELRSVDSSTFENLENALIERAHQEAYRFSLELKIEHLSKHLPTMMNSQVQEVITQAADTLGLKTITMNSGAGHDAQSMASLCPTGMLFVPSENGVSHSPREFTSWHDCVNGANVLLQTCLIMAYHLRNDL